MVGKRVGNQLEQQSTRSQSENEFTQHATLTIIQFVIHTSLRHYFSTGIIKEQIYFCLTFGCVPLVEQLSQQEEW